jgi:hypothetical protein
VRRTGGGSPLTARENSFHGKRAPNILGHRGYG